MLPAEELNKLRATQKRLFTQHKVDKVQGSIIVQVIVAPEQLPDKLVQLLRPPTAAA